MAAAKEATEARAATAAVKEAMVARAAVDTEADTVAKTPMAAAREVDMAASLASVPTTRAPAVAPPAHPAATARVVDTTLEAAIKPDVR